MTWEKKFKAYIYNTITKSLDIRYYGVGGYIEQPYELLVVKDLQYTGLQDVTGAGIYESDIVENRQSKEVFVVVWDYVLLHTMQEYTGNCYRILGSTYDSQFSVE